MAQQAQQDASTNQQDLRWYLAILKRHKLAIGLILALMVGATLVFTGQQQRLYTSTSKVLVKPVGIINAYYKPGDLDMITEAGVVSSEAVARTAAELLGEDIPPSDLLSGLKVEPEQDSAFLVLDYTDPVPATAQARSDAFARGYIQHRNEEAQAKADEQSEPIRTELAALDKQIPPLEQEIAETPQTDPAWARLNALLTTNYNRQSYLQQQMIPYDAYAPDGGEISSEAVIPTSPSSPSYPRNILLALVMGLALGVGFALVREKLDDRLRGSRELETAVGAPILATIPMVQGWNQRSATVMSSSTTPRGPVAEAYRTLRTNLQFIAKDEGFKIILITSSTAGEGKTTTAANLAYTLAQTGQRVVAVSCDLRKPRLHSFFGVSNQKGLSDILLGTSTVAETSQKISLAPSMRIIASGRVPQNPAELLGSKQMTQFVENLRKVADYVVLDCPPVLAVSDALVLSPMSDGVVIIADAKATSRNAVSHTAQQLEQVGANVVGAVLNNFDRSQAQYYPYDNNYYYSSHDYHDESDPRNAPGGRRGAGTEEPSVSPEGFLR